VWDGLQPTVLSEETRAVSAASGPFFPPLVFSSGSTRSPVARITLFVFSTKALRLDSSAFGIFSLQQLENQFQRKLHQTRVANLLWLTEGRALVAGISVYAIKLRVIENVENLGSEFHPQLFSDWSLLKQPEVPVVDRWIAAESAGHVAEGTERNVVRDLVGVKNKPVDSGVMRLEGGRHKAGLARALKSERTAL
jgi:hypothetical protein